MSVEKSEYHSEMEPPDELETSFSESTLGPHPEVTATLFTPKRSLIEETMRSLFDLDYESDSAGSQTLVRADMLLQVMEEYEKTISQLVTVKEETKAQMEKDKETIAAERDTALQHLSNMEVAFNDIHQKYERAKTVIETLHANEKELKKSYDAVVETVEAQNTAYQKLKQHAAEKLSAANAEIEKIHKEYNGEMARMKAVARKNELKCKSLEESLEQKKKELRELTQICDELIGKVTCQS
uniref:Transforming acidic coiled-coil-containing protein 1 n=1 Tax=Lygus hesperus TaxID=30085 RepID=A0A0A9Z0H9_LYGHE